MRKLEQIIASSENILSECINLSDGEFRTHKEIIAKSLAKLPELCCIAGKILPEKKFILIHEELSDVIINNPELSYKAVKDWLPLRSLV